MSTNDDVPDITIRPWRLDDFDAVKAILDDTFAGTWLPQLTPDAAKAYRESGAPVGYIDEKGPDFFVAEIDGEVAGYAYGSRHHERAAYRWTADVTVYISAAHHRRGVGRALYSALFDLLGRQGIHEVCAGVTLPNDASVGLHESMGFEPVGVYRDVAFKFGRWYSVGWWQLSLRPRHGREAPAEIAPPPRLPAP